MADLVIRGALLGDAPAMAEVYVAAARAGWAHIFPDDRLARLEAPEARMAEGIANTGERRRVLVAEFGGELVGFAVTRPSEDDDAGLAVGELDTFYAHPSVWGRGVGRGLMAEALAALGSCGFAEATLWTAEQNVRPRAIYEAAGWSADGTTREKTFIDVTIDELRYRIALA